MKFGKSFLPRIIFLFLHVNLDFSAVYFYLIVHSPKLNEMFSVENYRKKPAARLC